MPGLYEFCMSGQHEACSNHDCRCGCHPWVQNLAKSTQRHATTPTGSFVCSQCDRVPRAGDKFCRTDGAQLISGKICRCGRAGEPDDVFCGGCGQKFGRAPVPVPELSEEEIAALEATARQRPSDVEVPPTEVH